MEFGKRPLEAAAAFVPPIVPVDCHDNEHAEITVPEGSDPSVLASAETAAPAEAHRETPSQSSDTWQPYKLTDEATGHEIRGWVPAQADVVNAEQGTAEVRIKGETRSIDAGALGHAVAFNEGYAKGVELGHDCVIYAYACTSGDDVSNLVADPEGEATRFTVRDVTVDPSSLEDIVSRGATNDMDAGTVMALSTSDKPEEFFKGNVHYMVKATADGGDALYLSKFGAQTYVVLTTLPEAATAYGARSMARIGEIQPVRLKRISDDLASE